MAVGDFNGDGKLDLAVVNYGSSNVSILLGNGDGTFKTAVNYGAGSSAPYSVAVADFNGDGKLDLAVANIASNNVSILLGNGDGTFQAAVNYGAGSNPTARWRWEILTGTVSWTWWWRMRRGIRQRAFGQRRWDVPNRRELRPGRVPDQRFGGGGGF